MVERFEKFSFAISDITHYLHKIAADEMRKHGLRWPHAVCLVVLSRFEEGVTATELCEICGRDKADISRAISLLTEKGLVTKEGTKQNYRALIKLTQEGRAASEQIRERVRLAVEIVSKNVSDEHRAVFYEVLEAIGKNLQTISEQGLPE